MHIEEHFLCANLIKDQFHIFYDNYRAQRKLKLDLKRLKPRRFYIARENTDISSKIGGDMASDQPLNFEGFGYDLNLTF